MNSRGRWRMAVVVALSLVLVGCGDDGLSYRDRGLSACLGESTDERWQDHCYEEHEHWRVREERLKRDCIEAGNQVVDSDGGWGNDWSCLDGDKEPPS